MAAAELMLESLLNVRSTGIRRNLLLLEIGALTVVQFVARKSKFDLTFNCVRVLVDTRKVTNVNATRGRGTQWHRSLDCHLKF